MPSFRIGKSRVGGTDNLRADDPDTEDATPGTGTVVIATPPKTVGHVTGHRTPTTGVITNPNSPKVIAPVVKR